VDIAEFLAARLDEDDATANAAAGRSSAEWHPSPYADDPHEYPGSGEVLDAKGDVVIYDEGTPSGPEAKHIARHDPARVLREVAAGRTILRRHKPVRSSGKLQCEGCLTTFWPCPDLEDLATIWSDHPNYDRGWEQ